MRPPAMAGGAVLTPLQSFPMPYLLHLWMQTTYRCWQEGVHMNSAVHSSVKELFYLYYVCWLK